MNFHLQLKQLGFQDTKREEFLINSLPISVRNVIQTTFNALENRTWDALVKEITNYALDLDKKLHNMEYFFTFRSEEN